MNKQGRSGQQQPPKTSSGKLKTTMIKTLATIGTATALILTATTPAHATTVLPCTNNAICFFDTPLSTHAMIDHDDPDTSPGECLGMGSAAGRTTYITNRTNHAYHVYTQSNCGGTVGIIYAHTANMMNSQWDNKIYAYKRIG